MIIKTTVETFTTPYLQAYKTKPDWQKLIPIFSTAYVKVYKSTEGNNRESQTIPCTLFGHDTRSNRSLFYNPETKQLLGSSNYRLDTSHPSGPMLNLTHNGGLIFNLYDPSNNSDIAPAFHLNQTVHLKHSHPNYPSVQATILTSQQKPLTCISFNSQHRKT